MEDRAPSKARGQAGGHLARGAAGIADRVQDRELGEL